MLLGGESESVLAAQVSRGSFSGQDTSCFLVTIGSVRGAWGRLLAFASCALSTLAPSFFPFSFVSFSTLPPPRSPGGVCVCGRARAPRRHPLGRAAAVRVRVVVRKRAPVRGPQRTHPRRERGGATRTR